MSHVMFSSRCPACGASHDYQYSRRGDDIPPDEGDLTLCIECGALLYFDMQTPGCLRLPTPAEKVLLDADEELRLVRDAWWRAVGSKL